MGPIALTNCCDVQSLISSQRHFHLPCTFTNISKTTLTLHNIQCNDHVQYEPRHLCRRKRSIFISVCLICPPLLTKHEKQPQQYFAPFEGSHHNMPSSLAGVFWRKTDIWHYLKISNFQIRAEVYPHIIVNYCFQVDVGM